MTQAAAFMGELGNRYYDKNAPDYGKKEDLVAMAIASAKIKPTRVLEVGCGNGWRLKRLKDQYGCWVRGVDPSTKAVKAGNKILPNTIDKGTALRLPLIAGAVDTLIYGFCLWLCEPETWLPIVAEGDRVLANGGNLIIHDYIMPRLTYFDFTKAFGYLAWSFDWPKLWLGHPGYSMICEARTQNQGFRTDEGQHILMTEAATILRKSF